MDIWVDFRSTGPTVTREDLVSALLVAGVNARSIDQIGSQAPGLVFLDGLDGTVGQDLRYLSANGLQRVLGVVAPGARISPADVWCLLRLGASDVFTWDHWDDPASEVAARLRRWEAVDEVVGSPLVRNNLIGVSPAWKSVLRQIVEVARFTDASILITGESGCGKELAAHLIHSLDPRPAKRDLVVVDCTTVVPELSGSEFFGHERGAFTNAHAARDGAFALADGGTLFLDEVGELPLSLQAELLRVSQEHKYKRVGSNTWQETEFRLVCATNRNLIEEEARGQFRRDLFYRIAGCVCRLPALRERPEDILLLSRHFLAQLRPGSPPPEFDPWVRDYLLRREYPGNVRDLKQLMARIACRHVGPGPVTAGNIPEGERPEDADHPSEWCDGGFDRAIRRALSWQVGLKEIGHVAEEAAIRIAVDEEQGNLQRAARRLGVTDRALQLRRAARRQRSPERDLGCGNESRQNGQAVPNP
jgi:transcriptional regulator with GAF, ATPase, and Fis domain